MAGSETAIACFSLTGHTRRAAAALSGATGFPLLDFETRRYRGVFGVIRGLYDVVRRAAPEPDRPLAGLQSAGTVVLCGPIWAGHPAPPLRRMLLDRSALPGQVALLLTSGDAKRPEKTIAISEALLGRPFLAAECIGNGIDGTSEMDRRIAHLAARLSALPREAAE